MLAWVRTARRKNFWLVDDGISATVLARDNTTPLTLRVVAIIWLAAERASDNALVFMLMTTCETAERPSSRRLVVPWLVKTLLVALVRGRATLRTFSDAGVFWTAVDLSAETLLAVSGVGLLLISSTLGRFA